MKNIPNKIYLNLGEIEDDVEDFNELSGVTWCQDKVEDNDIEFQLPTAIDWEQRRFELIKSAVQGILSNPAFCNFQSNRDLPITITNYFADNIIKQLKEDK